MKAQIDSLVRSILHALKHQHTADPQLEPMFQILNTTSAREGRAVLAHWAANNFLAEDRQYAREQLEGLPPF